MNNVLTLRTCVRIMYGTSGCKNGYGGSRMNKKENAEDIIIEVHEDLLVDAIYVRDINILAVRSEELAEDILNQLRVSGTQ